MVAGACIAVTALVASGTTAPAAPVDPEDVQAQIEAAQALAAALQENAQAFIAEVAAILGTAPDDPQAAVEAIQAAIDGEVAALQGVLLAEALQLAGQVAEPLCAVIGLVTAASPRLPYPLDYSLFGPLADAVRDLDNGVSDALYNTYVQAFTTLLAPVTLPPGTEALAPYVALAQALLGLLAINWHTTYYPPAGGPAVVRDTPAFLNLPMVLDVDGRTGYDLCGFLGLDLATGGVSQVISRLPVSALTIPLDVDAQLLGGLASVGYRTKGSKAPTIFESSLGLGGTPVDTRLVQTGTKFTQTLGLAGLIEFQYFSKKPPTTYHFESKTFPPVPPSTSSSGTQINYTGWPQSDQFRYSIVLPTAGPITLATGMTPGANSFEYCTSSRGFCANAPDNVKAAERGSMHLLANRVVKVDQFLKIGTGADPTTCPAFAVADAHFSGIRFNLAHDPTAAAGHAWTDSDSKVVTGCIATASMTATLPAGFKANDRFVTWAGGGSAPPATSKSGTIVCPTGTVIRGGTVGLTWNLSRYLCVFAPVNSVLPAISGTAKVGNTLTATNGTWTAAPNAPTFTYQWLRCDALGGSCASIAGATANSYLVVGADVGRRLRIAVTGTNLEGSSTATSNPTAVVVP
jgi:hypothetical protein